MHVTEARGRRTFAALWAEAGRTTAEAGANSFTSAECPVAKLSIVHIWLTNWMAIA